jgi:hypothetical protein
MEPTTISFLLKVANDARKALDAAALQARVERIDRTVDAVGRHLEENVLAELRSAFTHLEAGRTITDPELSREELGYARQAFNRLAQRSGSDPLMGAHGSLIAAHVSALGQLGNYHYFLLRDQPAHALMAAYECTEQFPSLGVSLFPVDLFSRDYRDEVPVAPEEIRAEYLQAQSRHVEQRRRYGRDMAWRLPAAGGAFVAGLVGSAFNPSLAARGAQWATGILATNTEGLVPPAAPSRQHYLALAEEAERRLAPVADEAHRRLLLVQDHLGRSSGS